VNDHEAGDEELAAFLDGRMDARRRKEMLAHLNASEEDLDVLARTASILRELEEEDAAAASEVSRPAAELEREDAAEGVIPLDTRRPARAPAVRWMLIAAVLAGVALVTGRMLTADSVGGEPVRLAARLEQSAEGLPPGWTDRRQWTTARGDSPGPAPSPAERAARSARAGAMLVDLSVAVEARDAEATRVLSAQLAARFDRQGGRDGALRRISDGAGGSPERLRPLIEDATERIAARLDEDALRLGAWTEAAGIAAERRDAGFFRDRATRRALARAERVVAADPPARDALRSVRLLAVPDPPRWEALAPAIDALARELANE
jgi:hypothetical protein